MQCHTRKGENRPFRWVCCKGVLCTSIWLLLQVLRASGWCCLECYWKALWCCRAEPQYKNVTNLLVGLAQMKGCSARTRSLLHQNIAMVSQDRSRPHFCCIFISCKIWKSFLAKKCRGQPTSRTWTVLLISSHLRMLFSSHRPVLCTDSLGW